MTRLDDAFARFDAANALDPNTVEAAGARRPAELVYAEHMSAALGCLAPCASEALQLAARAQHLRRWTVPRASYPEGLAGYHRWRNDLKRLHAEWAGEILRDCGYEKAEIARVASLIRKEGLKTDPEAQTLEDAACLVFLEHYAAQFIERHDEDRVTGILAKTWSKMSDRARAAAGELSLAPRLSALLARALIAPSGIGERSP